MDVHRLVFIRLSLSSNKRNIFIFALIPQTHAYNTRANESWETSRFTTSYHDQCINFILLPPLNEHIETHITTENRGHKSRR